MNVIQFPQRDHWTLGTNALQALLDGRTDIAIAQLTMAWLDSAENREDALPIAKRIIAVGADSSGNGAA